ncbi:hypothetical protein [Priestia megaterium]|uniref:hypothetical protein n=1 Tax=Priestia megaterium TaxID=1404 RepID=UPI00263B5B7C|nr:hypothetical protein [Priestia megaterium]MDN4862794.1 hypothetical protein [Priestia megaterium]
MFKKRTLLGLIMLLLLLLTSCEGNNKDSKSTDGSKGNSGSTAKTGKVLEPTEKKENFARPKLSKMLDIIYDFEGGLLKDNDGTTNYGVLEENWIKYIKDKQLVYKDVHTITKEDASGYYEYYWKGEDLFKRKDDKNLYPYMTYPLALVVFDTKVLDGYGSKLEEKNGAFEMLQKVLNDEGYSKDVLGKPLDEDGDFHNDSMKVLKLVPIKEHLHIAKEILNERDIFHCVQSKSSKYNDTNNPIEGWLERVETLRKLISGIDIQTGKFTYVGKEDKFKNLQQAKSYCKDLLKQ